MESTMKQEWTAKNEQQRQEKRDVYARLSKFREEQGLGCLQKLAKKSNVPETTLRTMLETGRVDYPLWHKVGIALTKLGS